MWKAVAAVCILAVLLSAGVVAVSGPGAPPAPIVAGGQGPTPTADLNVTLWVNPESLNNRSQGNWVTARLNFTTEVARDVNATTLQLEGIAAAKVQILDNTSVMAKFPRADLIAKLPLGTDVVVTLTGSLTDGRTFAGSDTIRVFGKP